ncbi:MAG: hypothetical protein WD048_05705 [Chitinophagales bacterium]
MAEEIEGKNLWVWDKFPLSFHTTVFEMDYKSMKLLLESKSERAAS